jgi:hypothetical protein
MVVTFREAALSPQIGSGSSTSSLVLPLITACSMKSEKPLAISIERP